MDNEELRLLRLARAGKETIIKYGTYDVVKARNIFFEHPFYVVPEEVKEPESADPEMLAKQIISNNFRTGLSQEEVDMYMQYANA